MQSLAFSRIEKVRLFFSWPFLLLWGFLFHTPPHGISQFLCTKSSRFSVSRPVLCCGAACVTHGKGCSYRVLSIPGWTDRPYPQCGLDEQVRPGEPEKTAYKLINARKSPAAQRGTEGVAGTGPGNRRGNSEFAENLSKFNCLLPHF